MPSAQEITRKAKSNLAITLRCLPKERREDMVTFYAFCRVIDDLADDQTHPIETRKKELEAWKASIQEHSTTATTSLDPLQRDIRTLIAKYAISPQPFIDLIDGCSSDLTPQRFDTWEDLKKYTYRVACCVGIVSIKIFGCRHPNSDRYAVALGHALQITNIMRDVAEDLDNEGRIYLPRDIMSDHQYSDEDLSNHVYDKRFVAVMTDLAERAEAFYREAISLHTKEDAKALKAAEAMRTIYHAILVKMQNDAFRVFDQRYSVSKPYKVAVLLRTLLPW